MVDPCKDCPVFKPNTEYRFEFQVEVGVDRAERHVLVLDNPKDPRLSRLIYLPHAAIIEELLIAYPRLIRITIHSRPMTNFRYESGYEVVHNKVIRPCIWLE